MATPSKIKLDASERPAFSLPSMNDKGAWKASELLQENHEKHHIFFNQSGFHNHIAHHLLTIYALGATPEVLQRQYDANKSYQRPPVPLEEKDVEAMHNPENFKKYLGKEKYYHGYLVFFQQEMEEKGWQNVLQEYLFKGDERAEDMLVRMYAGFLHPIIHLGFGVEFQQPAIIAEALAQAAIHTNWIGSLLLGAEKAAKDNKITESKTLVQLLEEIRADKELSNAARWSDDNKVRDGIIGRAADKMIHYASQYIISPSSDLEEKTAEMVNAAVYYTGGAQHPPKQVKFDFYFMHCVNSSIFFSTFLKQDWLSKAHKIRLLEWKGRIDLAMYASRRSPELLVGEIKNYKPKKAAPNSSEAWNVIFDRVKNLDEDGHAAKLVRALANGKNICAPYENKKGFVVKGDMWDKLGNMVIDSVEDSGDHWARSVGFDEAWEKFRDRPTAAL